MGCGCCKKVFGAISNTILLVQPTKNPESTTSADYESVNECMEGVCEMSAEHLKRMNPNSPSVTHSFSCLISLKDLTCVVDQADPQTQQPYTKDWIKEKISMLLGQKTQKAGK